MWLKKAKISYIYPFHAIDGCCISEENNDRNGKEENESPKKFKYRSKNPEPSDPVSIHWLVLITTI